MIAMGGAKDILDQIDMDEKENFSDKTKAHFQQDPDFYRAFVKGIEREVNSSFPIVSASWHHSIRHVDGLTFLLRCSRTVRCRHLRVPRLSNT
jgi:hypothetical protein